MNGTGFLEQNEDPEQAVVREVKEELNLNTLETNLIGAYGFSEQNQVIIAYHLICQGDVLLNHELEAYKALPFEKVKPWSFGTGLAVRDWLSMRRKK